MRRFGPRRSGPETMVTKPLRRKPSAYERGGIPPSILFQIEDVRFQEQVRPIVIENAVAGLHPFAINDVAVLKALEESIGVGVQPVFEQVEMALTTPAL